MVAERQIKHATSFEDSRDDRPAATNHHQHQMIKIGVTRTNRRNNFFLVIICHNLILYLWSLGVSVVNNPSVSRRTTSRTPTVSPSRDFCEVVRLLKVKPSLYQDTSSLSQQFSGYIPFTRLIFGVFCVFCSGQTSWLFSP